ncbi:MAG: DNA internalization-related competence protein ComEC/Rec2 [Actinomycetota bacterium]|nr:DNA internalization-related competence protein ComEC/Rec2 [Actinomycetota bacterium]
MLAPTAAATAADGSELAGADEDRPDFRLVLPALATWIAAASALGLASGTSLLVAATLLVAGVAYLGRRPLVALPLLLTAAAFALAALRVTGVQIGPVTDLAAERATVSGEATVLTDPMVRPGDFEDFVLLRVRLDEVTGRGRTHLVRSPVLVIGALDWSEVVPGQRVQFSGRLDAADSGDLAAVLIARGPPEVVADPGLVAAAVNDLRAGLRDSVSALPPGERALVPALVDGDDTGMPEQVADEFRTTGLTHLLAVSGANLTLVLAFVLTSGRWCGVRARGLLMLGVLGVVGFVLLARPQPSVLRAAAMGVVALAGLTAGGRRRGSRALSAAVLVLLLIDPWLSRSPGFLLSVLATAGILLLAPLWRDRMSTWMPRWLAEAVAVPLAAQVVCTPVVAALSSQVSLVAVVANLLAAPAVGPTTVLGVIATLVAVVSEQLAAVVGWLAGRAAWWIITVAEHGAALPGADVPWPASLTALLALTLACAGIVALLSRLLRRRWWSLAVAALLLAVVTRPLDAMGWPPSGWALVACDVGQGDALVLDAGEGSAVVVDTGPDPAAVDRCLDRLEVSRVALVVLTHLHADHIGGLGGVLAGRAVGEIQVSAAASASPALDVVLGTAAAAEVPVRRVGYGDAGAVGGVAWSVVSPGPTLQPLTAANTSGTENNASVVMLVQVRDVRLLLTGDIEPEAQVSLLRSGVDLDVEVLKVPHHGSAHQDPDFLAATSPEVAVVSAGEDNGYGHPAPETLRLLDGMGSRVLRTDLHGDVAIVVTGADTAVVTR